MLIPFETSEFHLFKWFPLETIHVIVKGHVEAARDTGQQHTKWTRDIPSRLDRLFNWAYGVGETIMTTDGKRTNEQHAKAKGFL